MLILNNIIPFRQMGARTEASTINDLGPNVRGCRNMIHRNSQCRNRFSLLIHLKQGCILILFLVIMGQSPAHSENLTPALNFERVLVLPAFNMSEIHGENADLRGPLSGEVFVTDVVPPEALDFFDATLRSRFAQIENIHIIETSADTIASRIGLLPMQGTRAQRIADIQKIGRQSGADVVLCSYIYAFRDRVGTAYGVDTPARISFEFVLVSVSSGRLVWQGSYSETQKTLHDNLLRIDKFIQRKGRWITAKEMAEQAISDMVAEVSELNSK
jgi:hypothetical protein